MWTIRSAEMSFTWTLAHLDARDVVDRGAQALLERLVQRARGGAAADAQANALVSLGRRGRHGNHGVERAVPAAGLLGDGVVALLVAHEDGLDVERRAKAVDGLADAPALVEVLERLDREEHVRLLGGAVEPLGELLERHARLDVVDAALDDHAGDHADRAGVDHERGDDVGHLVGHELRGLVGRGQRARDRHDDGALVAVVAGVLEGLAQLVGGGQRRRGDLVVEPTDDLVRVDVDAALEGRPVGVVDAQGHDADVMLGLERGGGVGSRVGDDGDALVVHCSSGPASQWHAPVRIRAHSGHNVVSPGALVRGNFKMIGYFAGMVARLSRRRVRWRGRLVTTCAARLGNASFDLPTRRGAIEGKQRA